MKITSLFTCTKVVTHIMNTKEMFTQIIQFYNNMSLKNKLIIAAALFVILFFTVSVIVYFHSSKSNSSAGFFEQGEYTTLFNHLSNKDSSAVAKILQAKAIPFKVTKDGTIKVKKDIVYRERLELAAKGIPKNSHVGFEIFDTKDFGDTDFDKKVKYTRALEGELSRTIESIDSIDEASVHIAMPKDTLFIDKKQVPKVSVLLTLKSGHRLLDRQVNAIKHLVASSISGLIPEKVEIVDSEGTYLSGKAETNDRVALELKYKKVHEKMYEKRIEDLIAPFLGGKDRVVAKVSIEFDFSKQSSTSEDYSPDNTIKSEENLEENKTGVKKVIGGVPGVVSNIGPVQGLDNNNRSKYSKKQNILNYEISKKISKSKSEFARIKRVTAAVIIDGKYKLIKNTLGTITGFTYQKLPPATMTAIDNLTKQAIGYNTVRKDEVTVTNLQFESNRLKYQKLVKKNSAVNGFYNEYIKPFEYIIKYAVVFIILYFLYRKVLYPIINSILEGKEEHIEVEDSYYEDEEDDNIIERAKEIRKKISEELNTEDLDKIQVKFNVLLDRIIDIVEIKPKETASIITALLSDDHMPNGGGED